MTSSWEWDGEEDPETAAMWESGEWRQVSNQAPGSGDPASPAPASPPQTDPLLFLTAAELAAEVDGTPPLGFLVQGVIPADAHGVLAAEPKAGKTWGNIDLAVSVAAGLPWLDTYPIEQPGRVIVFLGEGGKRKMLRRFRAVCATKGVRFEHLPLELCFRVPHLTDLEHRAQIARKLAAHNDTVLVIVDSLYLAAKGAKGSSLYDMAGVLEPLQLLTQAAGCALLIIRHWNKTGTGSGADRMSGAGPMEWGRVLISVSVKARTLDKATHATNVTLDWHFEGDEIPDTDLRIRRTVWADNPDDLNSPLNYQLEALEPDDEHAPGRRPRRRETSRPPRRRHPPPPRPDRAAYRHRNRRPVRSRLHRHPPQNPHHPRRPRPPPDPRKSPLRGPDQHKRIRMGRRRPCAYASPHRHKSEPPPPPPCATRHRGPRKCPLTSTHVTHAGQMRTPKTTHPDLAHARTPPTE